MPPANGPALFQAPEEGMVAVDIAEVIVTASVRFGREWVGRFSWNRILSNYDRDTDIMVFGAGYRFSADRLRIHRLQLRIG